MIFKKLCLSFITTIFFICAFSQDNPDIKIVTTQLEKFRKNYPQEKVHLHLDKPYYSVGDTIYFTGYVVNAEKNTPSVISNILYVDLINDNRSVVQTLKFPVADGISYGNLYINDSLKEGNYHIRAYTNWMRNFDNAFFYDAVIAVGNGFNNDIIAVPSFQMSDAGKTAGTFSLQYMSLHNAPMENKEVTYSVIINKKEKVNGKTSTDSKGKLNIDLADLKLQPGQPALLVTHLKQGDKTIITKETRINVPAAKNNIQFFPEGGEMIAGVSNHIGFKATNENGLGINVSGVIKDDSTNESTPFQSGFAGIGSFQFTPQFNHSYHAIAQYKVGNSDIVLLPKANQYGYVLSVNNSDADSISINVTSKQDSAVNRIIIVGQTNNRIQFVKLLTLTDGNSHISLSKKKLPTGILQLTLFDTVLRPLAERLAFINHEDTLSVHVSFNKTSYSKREKTTMQLIVRDEKGNPVNGNFSLAVTDADAVNNKSNQPNILADLLLTSDIRGYVENANHYFDTVNETTIKALDDLLLTQCWRRFVWNDVLTNKDPSIVYLKEKSLSLAGKAVAANGDAVAGKQILLLPKKGHGYILDTITDANGNFNFTDMNFTDDYPFVLQASKTGNGKNVAIQIADFSAPSTDSNKNEPEMKQPYNSLMLPYLMQKQQQYDVMRKYGLLKNEQQLKDVVVTTVMQTRVQQAVASSYNLNGPGNADQILTYADFYNCHDASTCLAGKLTGVFFKMVVEDPNAPVKVWHLLPFSSSGMGAPMMVVWDGVYLTAKDRTLDMRNISIQSVQSIEVLRSGSYLNVYGMSGSGGVIVITSKQGGIDYDSGRIKTKPLEDVVFTTAKGYASQREFYTPNYTDTAAYNSVIPDKRTTIFWKPDITTDDNGNATIEWYNADNTGGCNIIIEGLSVDGKLAHASSLYKMK